MTGRLLAALGLALAWLVLVPQAAGSDLVERDGWFVRDYAWIKLVVGLIGLAALGVIAARWLRTRRA